jgi:hypothetical protein
MTPTPLEGNDYIHFNHWLVWSNKYRTESTNWNINHKIAMRALINCNKVSQSENLN